MQNRQHLAQLNAVLEQYEIVANKNATKLRLRLPAKEIWRYFVETPRHNTNYHLHSYFNTKALHQPQHHAHLNGSLYDVANTDLVTHKWDKFEKLFNLNETSAKAMTVSDILRYNTGWFLFELSEPGYLRALYTAFDLIFDKPHELSLAQIKHIHRTATSKVRNTNYDRGETVYTSLPGQVRNANIVFFPLNRTNTTLAGIHQILTDDQPFAGFRVNGCVINMSTLHVMGDITEEDHDYMTSFILGVPHIFQALCQSRSPEILADLLYDEALHDNLFYQSEITDTANVPVAIEKYLELLITEYNEHIRFATSMHAKLYTIVNFIQTFEQLHPFADANCRTFCMILLNQLLIANGMPLSLMHDANCFDSYSCDEVIGAVLAGMENTFRLIADPLSFGRSTNDFLALADESNTIGANCRYFYQVVGIEERARRRLKPYLEKRSLDEDLVQRPGHRARS